LLDKIRYAVNPFAGPNIGEHEWTRATHSPSVAVHYGERRADMGRQVNLVDDQEIGARKSGTALRWNLVAGATSPH
jgi:hypothetical protein